MAVLQGQIEEAESARFLQRSNIIKVSFASLSEHLQLLLNDADFTLPLASAALITRKFAEESLKEANFEAWCTAVWPRPLDEANDDGVLTKPSGEAEAWDSTTPRWAALHAEKGAAMEEVVASAVEKEKYRCTK